MIVPLSAPAGASKALPLIVSSAYELQADAKLVGLTTNLPCTNRLLWSIKLNL